MSPVPRHPGPGVVIQMRWCSFATVVLLACGVTLFAGFDASAAAPPPAWAAWSAPAGTSHDYRGTVQLPARGFPAATWTSDSRSPIQLPSGVTTFLKASTPVGAKYGSSQGSAYLDLRPYADNPTSPSTTTVAFAAPTPSAGWTFVLGDIDADQVRIQAADAVGAPVPNSAIAAWQHGAFNYAGGTDKPVWNPDTATLVGNAAALDTNGAADWFEPTESLSSLTFTFTQRAGLPIYQLWFAALSRTIAGTVTGTAQCPATAASVFLLGPDGTELARTTPAADGGYTFAGYAAQAGYTVAVETPAVPTDGCLVDDAARQGVDLTAADGRADFRLRDVVPEVVAGTVVTSAGQPVVDATVVLTPPVGPAATTTTDESGRYLFDGNAAGNGYQVSVTPPGGYAAVPPARLAFDIVTGQPVPAQNFVLTELPSVSGAVVGPDGPLEAVRVTLTDAAGHARSTITDANGRYAFEHTTAGHYVIALDPPEGYASPPAREGVTVAATAVPDQDFTLSRVGAVAGRIADAGGRPVERVRVTVTSANGLARSAVTGSDGTYRVDELTSGDYTLRVHPPTGYDVRGDSTRHVTITAAGELRGGLDFVVTAAAAPAPSPTPTSTSTAPGAPTGGGTAPPSTVATPPASGGARLAATGSPARAAFVVALALTASGVALLAGARRRRRT